MKFKIGELYYLEFLDHSVGLKGEMEIQAVGWVVKETSKCLILTSWRVIHDDKSIVDGNYEIFSVVKSCIKRKKKLAF